MLAQGLVTWVLHYSLAAICNCISVLAKVHVGEAAEVEGLSRVVYIDLHSSSSVGHGLREVARLCHREGHILE